MKLPKFFSKQKKMVISGLILLGCIILLGILVNYNNEKGTVSDSMMGNSHFSNSAPVEHTSSVSPEEDEVGINPVVTVEKPSFLEVKDIKTSTNNDTMCNNNTAMDPSELLPKIDGQPMMGAELVNATNKALNDSSVTLMDAGFHKGINTVGSSLRNANLQLRSEYAIPKTNVGPWSNSTIEADTLRKNLEIGSSV